MLLSKEVISKNTVGYGLLSRENLSNNTIFGPIYEVEQAIAWWKFDETSGTTINDSAGTYTGTAGAGTSIITGYSGNARHFNNGSTASRIDYTSPVIPYNSPKTIEFYIRRNGNPSAIEWLIGNAITVSNGDNGDVIRLDTDGKLYFLIGQSGSFIVNLKSNIAICNNAWHKAKFTWDGTTSTNAVKIHIDDSLNVQGTATAQQTGTPSRNLRIGANHQPTPSDRFGGDLDEIKIYNKVI